MTACVVMNFIMGSDTLEQEMTVTTTENNSFEAELAELNKLSDEQLTIESKIYYLQRGLMTIELGKRLIVMKRRLGYGEWLNWLEKNFNLSDRTARQFMQITGRFSKWQTSAVFSQSQLVELLALPAGEEEKFIESKKAEGTPVEDMTVKKLREEIQQFKRDNDALNNEIQRIQSVNQSNVNRANRAESKIQSLFADIDRAQKQNSALKAENSALKNQKPITVEPPDYQQLKKSKADLQSKIAELQKELNQKTVEVVTPADYDATKTELVKMQKRYADVSQAMDIAQKLDAIYALIKDVSTSQSENGVEDYAKLKPERFDYICAYFEDFLNFYYRKG